MGLEVIEYSFSLIRKHPKIILPQVLNWVNTAIITVLAYFALADFSSLLTNQGLSAYQGFLQLFYNYLAPFALALILMLLTAVYVQSVQANIVKQAFSGKSIALNKAFSDGKEGFLRLLWSFIVLFGIVLGILFLIIILYVIAFLAHPVVVAVFSIIMILAGIAALLYFLPGIFLIVPVSVLEKKSGFGAIKRSCQLSKGRKLTIWAIMILLLLFMFAISLITAIPVAGTVLVLPVYAFINTWYDNTITSFYFMVEKKAKPKA